MKATTKRDITAALKAKRAMRKEGRWPLGIIVENATMPEELIEEFIGLRVVHEHLELECEKCAAEPPEKA